jgi:uracil permease
MSDSQQHYRISLNPKEIVIGAQMLFVAFGALVLVPLLTGLNANVALFTAGAGTLIFQVVTRGKVPVFLASSFAFIAPIIYGVQQWGIPGTMCGLLAAGFLYIIISFSIRIFGSDILHKILPPIVTGPVIMVIGLVLAPVAVHMASGRTGDGSAWLVPLLPILCGIVAGYLTALILDATGTSAAFQASFDPGTLQNWTGPTLVSMQNVFDAPWLAVPDFTLPVWNLEAILFIVPVAIAPAIEHFGDVLAIGSITGKDYVDDPGIDKTMLGDGLATSMAALLGGPPNTTYSEVSGAVALTRSFNPAVMTWAAITAILLAFVGKLGGFLNTIPVPIMGGIMVLLFGAIAVIGINTLVRAGTDLMQPRNLTIVAVILVFGIGGMSFDLAVVKLGGIGLAGIIGVVLNLILPQARD